MIDGALVGACVQRFVRFLVYGPALPQARHPLADDAAARDSGHGRQQARGRRRRSSARARNWSPATSSASSSRARSAAPAICCRSSAASSASSPGLDVPIIPVYLDRVWGSVFSFKRGKFFWKLPERLPYPVTVAFGAPLPSTIDGARGAPGDDGARLRGDDASPPAHAICCTRRSCTVAKRRWRQLAMADSTGQKLTFGRTLVGVDAARPTSSARRTRGPGARSACCCRRRSAARSRTSRR